MGYGQLVIIQPDGSTFYRKVSSGHMQGIREFSKCCELGYEFSDDDYQEAPCILAADGYLVIKTIDDVKVFICYLPEYISDEQSMCIYNQVNSFYNYSMIGGYAVKKNENGYEAKRVHGTDEIMSCVTKRNIFYNEKKQSKRL